MLKACGKAADEIGMPFALYAANRLVELKLDVPGAIDYLAQDLRTTHLRSLLQAKMIRSILQMADTPVAKQAEQVVITQMANTEQFLKCEVAFLAHESNRQQRQQRRRQDDGDEEKSGLALAMVLRNTVDDSSGRELEESSRNCAPANARRRSFRNV